MSAPPRWVGQRTHQGSVGGAATSAAALLVGNHAIWAAALSERRNPEEPSTREHRLPTGTMRPIPITLARVVYRRAHIGRFKQEGDAGKGLWELPPRTRRRLLAGHRAGLRPVPMVRRRLEGERRTSRDRCLRCKSPCPARGQVKAIPRPQPCGRGREHPAPVHRRGFTSVALVQIGARPSTLIGRRRAPARPTERAAVRRFFCLFSLSLPASKFRR